MTAVVVVLVAVGAGASLFAGIRGGMDALGLVILAFIVGFGALAIAMPVKLKTGRVAPVRCDECGGVLSVAAPYCKHCGKRVAQRARGPKGAS